MRAATQLRAGGISSPLRPTSCAPLRLPSSSPLAHLPLCRCSSGERTSNSSDVEAASVSGRNTPDVFEAAGRRVQALLRGAGEGEDEILATMVSKTMPVEKLQTSAGLGAMVGITAVLIAVLCHKDPWGGATLSLDSLAWAGGGLVAGLPLVALRAWTWTPAASKVLPVVDDMHRSQMQVVAPWFTGMDRVHVVIMMAMEVLPLTLLLLPAAQGVVQGIAQLYAQVAGAVDPSLLPDVSAVDSVSGNLDAGVLVTRLVGLAATAGVAGAARGMELSISGDEYDAVSSAMENSDRYYRLTAMDVRSRKEDGDRASLAFRAVAQVYLDTRSDATILAAGLAAVDVMYLGGLWYATGNLAAPAAAALAVNWVEYGNLHARIGGTPANAKE